jgi:N-acetylneuraminic acid mutarotase
MYDSGGIEVWTRQFGTAAYDSAIGVAIDVSGNVVLGGGTLGALSGQVSAGSVDSFVAKLVGGESSLASIAVNPANETLEVGQVLAFTTVGAFTDGTSRILNSGVPRWDAGSSMNVMRGDLGGAFIGGIFYVAGGAQGANDSLADVEAYNPGMDRWTRVASMATGHRTVGVAVLDGRLYAVGGWNGGDFTRVEEYDPATDTWRGRASLQVGRRPAVASVGGRIYAFGGAGGGIPLASVEAYDPQANQWSFRAPMPRPRAYHSAVAVGNLIYVFGGSNFAGRPSEVDAYDPATDSWVPKAAMLTPRDLLGSAALGGRIYAVGGRDNTGGIVSVVDVYDPVRNEWSPGVPMPTARYLPAVDSHNGRLYVAGGGTATGFPLGTLEVFTPTEVVWSSSDLSVAPIDAGGLATGASPGTATLSATSGSVSGFASLTVVSRNSAPVAVAGGDQVLECDRPDGALVLLDGTGSSDSDGDSLTYTWNGPFGTLMGATVNVVLPLGTSEITLTVDDGRGGTSTTVLQVTVEDHGPPVLSVPAPMTLVRAAAVPREDPDVQAWLASALAVDAFDIGPIMVTNDAPAEFGFGATVVTFTATDACGNSASGTSTLILVNTGPGGGSVSPVDSTTGTTPVTVTFSNVTEPGQTTLVTSTQGPPPPTGFRFGTRIVYYEIVTTATYTGPITVCIDYTGTNFNTMMLDELQLWHHNGNGWERVTTSHDLTNHIICGTVTSLSPFAVLEPVNRPPVAEAGPDQVVECTGASGALVTLAGAGADPEGHPLSYVWSGGFGSATGPGLTLTLPLGIHTLTLTVTDVEGATAEDTVLVTVQDTTPPSISGVPAPITAECASDAGTPVTVPLPIATDLCDPAPRVTSDAPPMFPKGVTLVTFTAMDRWRNVSQRTTTVTVVDRTPASLGPVAAPLDPVQVGTAVTASVNYSYACGPHTALWTWGDGTQSAGTVTEGNGTGTASGSHAYTTPGVYTVSVTVTDEDRNEATGVFQYVVVYDPNAGFVTGGGWINSPAGAFAADPVLTGKANFGFVSKYQPGATVPTGRTEFQFKAGNLNFHSSTYEWLVVAGARAQFKGTGTINGAGSYEFLLTAIDGQRVGGGGTDRFRIKIWGAGGVVYDNQPGAPDNGDVTTALGGGSIVIHNN